MRFFITYDAYWEAKIDKVLDRLNDTGYKNFFIEQKYGDSVRGITIVLMCQDPNLHLKQRIKFSKKEAKLYLDIMLDQDLFIKITQEERNKIVAEKIMGEVPEIIAKYKFKDFDLPLFKTHLTKLMNKVLTDCL